MPKLENLTKQSYIKFLEAVEGKPANPLEQLIGDNMPLQKDAPGLMRRPDRPESSMKPSEEEKDFITIAKKIREVRLAKKEHYA